MMRGHSLIWYDNYSIILYCFFKFKNDLPPKTKKLVKKADEVLAKIKVINYFN